MRRGKTKRQMSPLDYSAFFRDVFERDHGYCYVCRFHPEDRWKCVERSGGILDAHHWLSQSLLKRELPMPRRAQALSDARSGVLVGRWHHGQLENHRLQVPIPDAVREFAADYGLGWYIERQEAQWRP